MKQYTLLELCAGTGGFSVGFGYRVQTLLANDLLDSSKKCFQRNFPETEFICGDANTINTTSQIDIISSGFSCQPFSQAGSKKGFNDTRSDIFFTTINLMTTLQPKVAILENVKNILTHNNNQTLQRIIECIAGAGYKVEYKLLDTAVHSPIPQHRERVYFICIRNDTDILPFFPSVCPYKIDLCEFILENVDAKYYYDNRFKDWDTINNSVVKHKSDNTVYQYRRTFIRENKSSQCPTLTCNMGLGGHNVPLIRDDIGVRKITPTECFCLQGFPKQYILPKLSDGKLYSLAGNAISIPIASSIASHMVLSLDNLENKNVNNEMQREILDVYTHFKNYYISLDNIYTNRTTKTRCRLPNFPEFVSENFVKIFLQSRGETVSSETVSGDLSDMREVKCVNSTGPISFSPSSQWKKLYIIQCVDLYKDEFIIYEIELSSEHDLIRNIMISKTETFQQQRDQKRRPRITLNALITQLGSNMKRVFTGNVYELLK